MEYELPLADLTVDALLIGYNALNALTAVVIELKQWSQISLGKDPQYPFSVSGMAKPQRHPSAQAVAYRDDLVQCHAHTGQVQFVAAAFLHEMKPGPHWDLLHGSRTRERLRWPPCSERMTRA